MTEVLGQNTRAAVYKVAFFILLLFGVAMLPRSMALLHGAAATSSRPAEQLYLQLRSVELDPARVYEVREGALDYPKLHITFDDGKIAFTTDVYGKITGAFFEGSGELLVVPPDQAERASLSLFTGAAILEESFHTAYVRFNDDAAINALQPRLRPTSEGKDFVGEWGDAARNLAATDALRLFLSFSKCLPASERTAESDQNCHADAQDRFLHARVQGSRLGVFDVTYDSLGSEAVSIGQQKVREGISFYNVWTQFAVGDQKRETRVNDEVGIRDYQIDVQVHPPTNLESKAHLNIDMLQGGSRSLLFELSRYLKVSSITSGSRTLEFIQNQAVEGSELNRRGNDLVVVVFPEALQAGQKVQLDFAYSGDVLSEAGSGLLYVGARGTWYPNRGMAAANFDLRFRYPSGWSLLATGTRLSTNERADEGIQEIASGEKTSRWVTKVTIPVAGFNLGKYSRAEARAGDAVIETYAAAGVERSFPKRPDTEIVQVRPLPGIPPQTTVPLTAPPLSPARNAQMVADAAAGAVKFFSERFGAYPYGSLRLTQMPGPLSQGWPGLIFLSSLSFLLPEERAHVQSDPIDAILGTQVTAHETAHQWWGDLVYWRGYRDQWLSEGLANYSSLMMLEAENPAAFHRVMARYRDNLLEKNRAGAVLKNAGPVTLGQRLSSSEFPAGYEAISYGRGTWLFHMLRHILDDAPNGPGSRAAETPFVRALRALREKYAGKPVSTREVLQTFAEYLPVAQRYEGKKQLDWFSDGWVNGMAIPRLELDNVKMVPGGKSVSVSGTIVQKDAPKSLVTSVPLYAQVAGNRRVLAARVFADGPESSFHITAPAGTRKVLLDVEETVLRQ